MTNYFLSVFPYPYSCLNDFFRLSLCLIFVVLRPIATIKYLLFTYQGPTTFRLILLYGIVALGLVSIVMVKLPFKMPVCW